VQEVAAKRRETAKKQETELFIGVFFIFVVLTNIVLYEVSIQDEVINEHTLCETGVSCQQNSLMGSSK
jgi:hypothetical protein